MHQYLKHLIIREEIIKRNDGMYQHTLVIRISPNSKVSFCGAGVSKKKAIIYSNCQRSGTVSNMTLNELARRVPHRRSRDVVVSVSRHKTAEKHGSARVVIECHVLCLLLRLVAFTFSI